MTFFVIILFIILALTIFKIWVKLTTGVCTSYVCLLGKTVIVTGANAGIGYEAALDMAMRGAKVILACRNKDKAEEAKDKIIKETKNANIIIRLVDFTSFTSVRKFAKEINETENQLDILINNAGAGLPDATTEDGHQILMQTNYFSPVLLTVLLIDLLKKTPNSRIVNVASFAARWTDLDVDNPDKFTWKMYGNTKLANILFTIELASRLKNTSVTTYSLHPGVVYTDIFRTMPPVIREIFMFIVKTFYKTAREGAQTTIYCAVQKGIEHLSGEHFSDCAQVSPYKTVNIDDAKKLWNKTMEIINVTPHL